MTDVAPIASLAAAITTLPVRFKGPGGAVGVVKDGAVICRHAWGYADLEIRLPMTAGTLMPICSISKQFTCGVLLDLAGDPSILDETVADFLPNLQGSVPTVAQLCHNQSGLRDYWALTVLHGAAPEGVFRREDLQPILAGMRTTHFQPGSHYSYCNTNFRILSDLIERRTDRALADLYRERIFERAGMETATLAADTGAPLNDVVGYEGNDGVGFFRTTNRIFWTGDAGIAASLEDMLAWECFIDRTRDDPDGLYNRLSRPQAFCDDTPSQYGFGLVREIVAGVAATRHGGALRGFRCHRLHAASERLSVVVMFNHEADARAAATILMKAALGRCDTAITGPPPSADWSGAFLEPSTGLVLKVAAGQDHIGANFTGTPERLALGADGVARAQSMRLKLEGDAIRIERPADNLKSAAIRISSEARTDIEGRFVSREFDASLHIAAVGGAFYISLEGFLGKGAMHPIYPVGDDLWFMRCPRSMDAPAPGNWTIQVKRDDAGRVCQLNIGCWLARKLVYAKAG